MDPKPPGTRRWGPTTPSTTEVLPDADARAPSCSRIAGTGRAWTARQTLHDPEGHHDWVIEAPVDLDASDVAGEPVLVTQAFRRLDA